jgi:hypothetical protein
VTFERAKKLFRKLQKRAYRHAYVGEHVRRGIAHQIRALREDPSRNWTQGELSKRLKKPQSVVSRMEDLDYGKFTVQTLLEIANAFDVALSIRFVSYPQFVAQTRDTTEGAMRVASFDQSELSDFSSSDLSRAASAESVLNAMPSRQFAFNRPPRQTLLAPTRNTLLAWPDELHPRGRSTSGAVPSEFEPIVRKSDVEAGRLGTLLATLREHHFDHWSSGRGIDQLRD